MLDRAEKEITKKTTGKHNKREKFVELAESRTRNAIRAIRIIAKLGNKNAYDYSRGRREEDRLGAEQGSRGDEGAHVADRR